MDLLPLVTMPELCELLSVPPHDLRALIGRAELVAIEFGNILLIPRNMVLHLLNEKKTAS
jgi:hypothetical protein